MKKIIFAILFITTATLHSDVITPEMHKKLPPAVDELYRLAWIDLSYDFLSYDSSLGILFFDIDYDGIPEAFVACHLHQHLGGCGGLDWNYYRFENGVWKWKREEGSLFARRSDFYSLIEEGKPSQLLVLWESWDKDVDGEYGSRSACRITIDKDGKLAQIQIPEYEFERYPVDPANRLPGIELKSPKDTLTPLPFEILYPAGWQDARIEFFIEWQLMSTRYRVGEGDTLSGIAKKFYGDALKWPLIYEANKETIKNPNLITDRMTLTIPKMDRSENTP